MTRTEWFNTYFSEPYGEVYAEYLMAPEMTEREVDFVVRVLGLASDAALLDCPCGYGRHVELFSRRFDRVVGLDLNHDCLRRAGESLLGPLMVRGDMRSLPFGPAEFNAAINVFNSFGYFGEAGDRRVLEEFARVLKPGGKLVLDVANPTPLIELIREQSRTQVQIVDLLMTEDWRYDSAAKILHNDTLIELPDRKTSRSYDVRLYTLGELTRMLDEAGFRVLAVYGEFDGEPYEEEESGRLIVVARRG